MTTNPAFAVLVGVLVACGGGDQMDAKRAGHDEEALRVAREAMSLLRGPHVVRGSAGEASLLVLLTVSIERLSVKLRSGSHSCGAAFGTPMGREVAAEPRVAVEVET